MRDRRRLRAKRIEDLVPVEPGTLGALALRYLEHLETRGYSPHTVRTARIHLRLFLVWADERGIEHPEAVDLAVLERYQRSLFHHRKADGAPLSFQTQYDRLGGVRRFLHYLRRTRAIPSNPADLLEPPRVERRLPKAVLSAEEAEAALAQPEVETVQGLRDRAVLETFYATGVRRQELIRLSVYDLDAGAGVLAVRQGKGKKDRRVPISERAVAWVTKYLEEARPALVREPDEGVLFLTSRGDALSPALLTHRVRSYLEAAGITKPGSCHLFRHTVATLMLDGGAELRHVQAMLGHSDISTTQVYTRVALAKLRLAYEKSHPGVRLHRPPNALEAPVEPPADDEKGGAPETTR